MNLTWHIEKRKISDLKDFYKNPRKLSKEQEEHLKTSLQKFGLIDKPIINLDNTIIGGHQRKKTLKKMGVKEIECNVPNRLLESKEIEELNIRLNKNTGDWDYNILTTQWELLDLLEWGFKPEEFEIKTIAEAEEDCSEILEPGKDEDAITKLGDLYELNGHRLICGDSTNPEYTSKILDQYIPILMITDPPYGVEYDPTWRKDIKEKKGAACRAAGKVQNDDKVNWSLAWHLFPGSISYVWHAGKYCAEVQKSLEECEFEIVSQIIWKKQHFVLSRGDYHWEHEPCWYAVKKGHKHNWQGNRKQTTVWEISNLNAFGKSDEVRTAHSTQKPVECMAKPILNNSCEGDYIYDPFIGSGTTLIAAEQLNRKCIGIELSPAYCDIIINRWINWMKKQNKSYTIKKNSEDILWLDPKNQ